MYCVGGSLKNLCHFEMGGLANADVIRGGRSMLTGGRGDKICQNLADVICERSLTIMRTILNNVMQNKMRAYIRLINKTDRAFLCKVIIYP